MYPSFVRPHMFLDVSGDAHDILTRMSIEKDYQTWEGIAAQCDEIAERLRGQTFDAMLVITRGGMIPGSVLGYRLGIRNILVAAVEFYDDDTGHAAEAPTFLQFPADPLLRGQHVLVVDEVWDTGRTIAAVLERVRLAGGKPTTAVLHYKPKNSMVNLRPDHYARETHAWIVYPWSRHEKKDV